MTKPRVLVAGCTVCGHPDLEQIERHLVAGINGVRWIGAKFQVGPSALWRHKKNHLNPSLTRVASRKLAEESAESVYDELRQLYERVVRWIDRAESSGSLMGGAALFREARQFLETIGRITGELDDRAQVNVLNIATDPEWVAIRAAVFETLAMFPEARLAVAERLRQRHALEAG